MVYSYNFINNSTAYIPPNAKTAILAGGCFWCVEEAFERYVPGVIEAVSGYSGGTSLEPSYYDHAGHVEVVLVIYDPALTSYETILQYVGRTSEANEAV